MAAETRGREMLETEPRAKSAQFDRRTGRVVLELANGCTYLFPVHLVEDLHDASPHDLSFVKVEGHGFNLSWPKLGVDLVRPCPGGGRIRNTQLDDQGACASGRVFHLACQGSGSACERCKGRTTSKERCILKRVDKRSGHLLRISRSSSAGTGFDPHWPFGASYRRWPIQKRKLTNSSV